MKVSELIGAAKKQRLEAELKKRIDRELEMQFSKLASSLRWNAQDIDGAISSDSEDIQSLALEQVLLIAEGINGMVSYVLDNEVFHDVVNTGFLTALSDIVLKLSAQELVTANFLVVRRIETHGHFRLYLHELSYALMGAVLPKMYV